MLVNEVYAKMFTGEGEGLPAFGDLDGSEAISNDKLEIAITSFSLNTDYDIESIDINDWLKAFKKSEPELAEQLINQGLEFYLTHPKVLSGIQNGRETLFPNARTLSDIDYDLLIPVVETEKFNE